MEPAVKMFNELMGVHPSLDAALSFTDQVLTVKEAQAKEGQVKEAYGVVDTAINALMGAGRPLFYASLVAPPAIGYLGGKVLADAYDASPGDLSEIQEQELIAELLSNAEAVRQRRKLRGVDEEQN